MSEFVQKFLASDLMPHGCCYLWKPEIIWLHAISDASIALAYYLIPLNLIYFVRKRRDLPFDWMFVLFGIFIFGCGTTHLLEVWTLWHGTYRLTGAIKAVTAAASLITAGLLVPLIPRALALPSPAQLRTANLELKREIGERVRIDQALQKAHDELELRVRQRTAELARANEQLQAEIMERWRAERDLRKQASLLDLAHDAIIVRDMHGTILYWNSGAEETYGWPKEQAVGDTVQQLLHSVYPLALENILEKLMREGRWDGEINQTRRDGRRIVVASRWALQRDEEQTPVAILQINTDITEYKETEQAKEAAEAANRSKGRFLANMSHEIRTPMNGIISMTGLVLETDLAPEQRECLEIVKESADSLLTIINDILDFSKIDADKLILDPIDFNLRDSLVETIRMLAPAAQQKQLELVLDIQQDVPEFVHADLTRLRQIIVNLVSNAIKFTTQGEVVLRIEKQSDDAENVVLHFMVQDTGVGIAPEKQGAIFDPFTQEDDSTTRRFGGTGLGLTIAARLTEMMEGRVWVESEIGHGSQFHFTVSFPRARCLRPLRPLILSQNLADIRVLIVDDNESSRRVLGELLRMCGAEPELVSSAEAALRALYRAQSSTQPFHILLTDVEMPELDGFALAERIRNDDRLCETPILMLSSAGKRGDVARCRELGIGAYLTKPIQRDDLRNAIASVLPAKGSPSKIDRSRAVSD